MSISFNEILYFEPCIKSFHYFLNTSSLNTSSLNNRSLNIRLLKILGHLNSKPPLASPTEQLLNSAFYGLYPLDKPNNAQKYGKWLLNAAKSLNKCVKKRIMRCLVAGLASSYALNYST